MRLLLREVEVLERREYSTLSPFQGSRMWGDDPGVTRSLRSRSPLATFWPRLRRYIAQFTMRIEEFLPRSGSETATL